MENTSRNSKKEMLTNRKTYFSPHFLWGAEFFYVYDSNGNIVRATEVDIELSGGKTMSAFG